MKTTIYIDGFNLYYGAINKTSYKWLDVVSLFSHICKDQEPSSKIVKVKFFTAPVKAKIATHGLKAVKSQESYHKALRTLYPDIFELIEGRFQVGKKFLPVNENPINKKNRVEVWTIEEKKTDVNIALNMTLDAITEKMEQVVLVSNDTDLVPAFEAIQKHHPQTKLAVIIPRNETKGKKVRPANKELLKNSDWVRHHITEEELKNFQLPKIIPMRKKAIIKPSYW